MAGFAKSVFKISLCLAIVPFIAFAAQQPNPRGANNSGRSADLNSSEMIRRSATSVIARTASPRKTKKVVSSRPNTSASVGVRSARSVINTSKSRSATKPALARNAGGKTTKKNTANVSRAASARATAVFNDITKIGGGYANCRDAYATCMDQFCANANDTYRRCFCSDRFTGFRDSEDKLDEALSLLAQFQDNNLNAVDKTAAEVNAMYTATAGEEAIKRDTSASQKLLDSISDVLSGKSSSNSNQQSLTSLGILDFSGFSSVDPWSTSSSFGGEGVDITEMEGKELYNNALQQCSEITQSACGGDAMFNLARSAYSIMITQDCNAYEKAINAKRASIEETVRTTEKYLRDARLEEYRAHNSQDVNECLARVESAMRQPTACGENYEKCMDYTGLYINSTTGEPIYSQALFGLNNLIKLNGSSDVLGANPDFDKWLEARKTFATTALDTCRDLSDTVWTEFKRSALIQISQAQDEKIQRIKDSCVTTIKECYDTQNNALKQLDDTQLQSSDAISAVAARGMCFERVQACAALYGDVDGCKYDDATKKLTAVSGKKCGLQALLTFVDTVDSVRVAEGCESALTKYAHELCDPEIGNKDKDIVYPMGCATMPREQLRAAMNTRRETFCPADLVNADTSNTLQDQTAFNTNIMNQLIKDIYDELGIAFTAGCEGDPDANAVWVSAGEIATPSVSLLSQTFYKKYYGTTITRAEQITDLNLPETGWCILADGRARCESMGVYMQGYNESTGECELTDAWYSDTCKDVLGGRWVNDQCVINDLVPTTTELRKKN